MMQKYVLHDANGNIIRVGICATGRLDKKSRPGLAALEIDKRMPTELLEQNFFVGRSSPIRRAGAGENIESITSIQLKPKK